MIKSTQLDKLAIFLSGVCLIHCLITPVLITLLPILSLNAFVEDLLFHQLMVWLVLPISFVALFIGCRKHRYLSIAATGMIGLLILIVVAFWGHEWLGESNEKIATSIGGLVLAVSHFLNYRTCQSITCSSKNCSSQHHH